MTTSFQPAGGPTRGRFTRAIAFARGRWKQISLLGVIVTLAVVAAYHRGECDDLPDFRAITDTNERKAEFIACLVPMIEKANREIILSRERLLAIDRAMASGMTAGPVQWNFVRDMAKGYEMPDPVAADRAVLAQVLQRVDAVPVSLVVAQAAIESGWGTSRFSRHGNNLFGMRTYGGESGMIPRGRAQGESFKVAVFPGACEAIRAYIHNLNTDERYRDMRVLRERMRKEGTVTGDRLADGLLHYSERGADYVGDVKAIISSNELGRFDS
ncbi:MAG TPA: glucosaminidase domain-containing protein [Rariglobus sp.]|nr:glucosaminidase domain-containing protein [Rariglobus sp.]